METYRKIVVNKVKNLLDTHSLNLPQDKHDKLVIGILDLFQGEISQHREKIYSMYKDILGYESEINYLTRKIDELEGVI